MFEDIAEAIFMFRNGDSDASADELGLGLAEGRVFGEDAEGDFGGLELWDTFINIDEGAVWGVDAGDGDEVLGFDTGVSQGEFEGDELDFMLSYTFGEEDAFGA